MLEKLAYVVVREDLDGPILQSQVIEILSRLAKDKSKNITLLWFYRIDFLFRGERRIRDIKRDLHEKGIDMVAIPFISLGFPVSWYLIPFVLPQWWLGILWVYFVKKKNIFHCRSYHAALAGMFFKYIFPVKLIFDPRSPFPEENVAANRWKSNRSINYKFWKKIEKLLCQKSDRTIAISEPFRDSLNRIAINSRIEVIPNNYPVSFNLNSKNEKQREKTEIIKICYIGSFGHWNNPGPYFRFLAFAIKNSRVSIRAKFIVSSKTVYFLEEFLEKEDFDRSKLSVQSVLQSDMFNHMSDCVVGLQIMTSPDDRLSIKFVEYLSAGLPVIVSENVRGAADIVKKYEVGYILKSDLSNQNQALEFIYDVSENREIWRDKCKNIAEELFSPEVISKKLKSVYETV